MNRWRFLAGCGLLLALIAAAAIAQDKKKADNRPAQELAHLRGTVEIAQKAYQKLQAINAKAPGRISDEDLSGASLTWLKAEMRLVATKSDAIRVTSEYLQREGIAVGEQSP